MSDLNKIFVDNGLYKLKNLEGQMFLCEKVNAQIGKLVAFREISPVLYRRTNISYFLNNYKEGDMKELFVNRDNYDMVGRISLNYALSVDKKFLKPI